MVKYVLVDGCVIPRSTCSEASVEIVNDVNES